MGNLLRHPTDIRTNDRPNIHASEITRPKISHQTDGTMVQSTRAIRDWIWSRL